MKIELYNVNAEANGEKKDRCYVHARGLIMPDGSGLMTTQKLLLSGCDVFYGIELMKTSDGGRSFSAPALCKNLVRRKYSENLEITMCDATPFFHKKTGKIILIGHSAIYNEKNKLAKQPCPRYTMYSVYNEDEGDFGELRTVELDTDTFYNSGAGCVQIEEAENGDLLIPFYYTSYAEIQEPHYCSSVSVMRCVFDGERISVKEIGAPLRVDMPRGLGEPSIVSFDKEYFLALRNDATGYVAKSSDGLSFSSPKELCFDDGENLGNYNTQQHWLTGGGKLWLVYTRRAGFNDHIFRHRAPLFIAEFDTVNMCVVRSSEQIAVKERGARLGNFGCQSYSDETGFIYAAEWMQNDPLGWDKCAEYGSDNSIFISKISF